MRVTLDANILVYALQAADRRHARARDVVARAIAADCVQTLQSFSECFNALVRKRLVEPEEAMEAIARLRRSLTVEAAEPDDLDRAMWATLRHRLAFWDAMLWATAHRAGCRLLITEDQHDGRELDGLRFTNPFAPENDDLIDRALPSLETDHD